MRQYPGIWLRFKLWFFTLFYHSNFSRDYIMDTLLEPLFWLVDHLTNFVGRAFVILVIFLIFSVVLIAHFLGLPFYLEKDRPFLTSFLVILGYWIWLNITYNFYKTAVIGPGISNEKEYLDLVGSAPGISLCKKCIRKKPPRTHHCSICNRCYLKMDHHCPWVNNCIGHFNHRYFYLTMSYIVIGCIFIMIFGFEIGYRQIILEDDILTFKPYPIELNHHKSEDSIWNSNKLPLNEDSLDNTIEKTHLLFEIPITRHQLRFMIFYAGILCIGCTIALGSLLYWHGKLISNGETSIEYHINKTERKRVGKGYVNPYDLGRKRNWELFLGLDSEGRSFTRHILLPSSHPPTGSGYEWTHITKYTIDKCND